MQQKTKINLAGVQSADLQKSLICARELKRLHPNQIEFDE